MTTATAIAAPAGFHTITLFHDSVARRKGDRGWKITLPVNENMTEAIRLDLFDGVAQWDGASMFDEAVALATDIVTGRFGIAPDWFIRPNANNGVGIATWRFRP